jgi:hypothetical protein
MSNTKEIKEIQHVKNMERSNRFAKIPVVKTFYPHNQPGWANKFIVSTHPENR